MFNLSRHGAKTKKKGNKLFSYFSRNCGIQVDDSKSYDENVKIINAQIVDHQLKRVNNQKVKTWIPRKLEINLQSTNG